MIHGQMIHQEMNCNSNQDLTYILILQKAYTLFFLNFYFFSHFSKLNFVNVYILHFCANNINNLKFADKKN